MRRNKHLQYKYYILPKHLVKYKIIEEKTRFCSVLCTQEQSGSEAYYVTRCNPVLQHIMYLGVIRFCSILSAQVQSGSVVNHVPRCNPVLQYIKCLGVVRFCSKLCTQVQSGSVVYYVPRCSQVLQYINYRIQLMNNDLWCGEEEAYQEDEDVCQNLLH